MVHDYLRPASAPPTRHRPVILDLAFRERLAREAFIERGIGLEDSMSGEPGANGPDYQLGPDKVHDRTQLCIRQECRDRLWRSPQFPEGETGFDELETIWESDRDQISAAHTQRGKHSRSAIGASLELAARHVAISEREHNPIGISSRVEGRDLTQWYRLIHFTVPAPPSGPINSAFINRPKRLALSPGLSALAVSAAIGAPADF
jgi:hypothetical protein